MILVAFYSCNCKHEPTSSLYSDACGLDSVHSLHRGTIDGNSMIEMLKVVVMPYRGLWDAKNVAGDGMSDAKWQWLRYKQEGWKEVSWDGQW